MLALIKLLHILKNCSEPHSNPQTVLTHQLLDVPPSQPELFKTFLENPNFRQAHSTGVK